MDDSVSVEVLECVDDLESVTLNFQFVEALSPAEEFVHGLVLTELQQNVHVFRVLEEVLELHHVWLPDRAVDLYLAHQLLLRPALRQRCLLNYFRCSHCFCFLTHKLKALSKSSFTEEFSFDVSADLNVAIVLHDLFLDNLRNALIGLVGVH